VGIAVMFPGQGTQAAGMGLSWRHHAAWSVVERAEAALGEPLAHLLLTESAGDLARTRESQLSVLLASLLAWEAAGPVLPTPVAFAGHSLGQVTALIAAGVLSLEEGVRLAARRAELTQAAADRHPGGMAALLGADEAQAEEACSAAPDECWLANDNAPGQLVIAGTPSGIERATKAAGDLGIRRVMPLKVGGAFHTPLMQEAADAFAEVLAGVTFASPSAPVVSNVDARAYGSGDTPEPPGGSGDTPDGWRARLATHLVSPVRWRASMVTMSEELGATAFVEVGCGSMLAGLAKRGAPGIPVFGVGSPADVASLPEVHT
jgi:[acyl-carrier-protein] S-malonyltransferase